MQFNTLLNGILMEQNVTSYDVDTSSTLAVKSWTAYIKIALLGFFLLFVLTPYAWFAKTEVGVVVMLISVAFLTYKVLLIKSYHLYWDGAGVWCYSGVLPWRKGTIGVKWRDLDEAVMFQSMGSWLFKSYSIRIGHRFTKSNEIILTHMAHGHEAVMAVNKQHQELVRAGIIK